MPRSRAAVAGVAVAVSVLAGFVGGFLAGRWVWGVSAAALVFVAAAAGLGGVKAAVAVRTATAPLVDRSAPAPPVIVGAARDGSVGTDPPAAAGPGVDRSTRVRRRAGGPVAIVVASCALLAAVTGTGFLARRPGRSLAERPSALTVGLPPEVAHAARQPSTVSGSPDRSAPSVVLLRYVDARFHDRSGDPAQLWECGSPHLAALDVRLTDLRGRQAEYGVSMTVQATNLIVASRTATTAAIEGDLTISVSAPGAPGVEQRLVQPWHFDLVQEAGWRVCAAQTREPPPSSSPTPAVRSS